MEEAVKDSPENSSIHLHLGLTYSKLNRKADAVTQLKKAAEGDPKSKVTQDANAALAKLG